MYVAISPNISNLESWFLFAEVDTKGAKALQIIFLLAG
jgi:hypothetical protein